MNRKAAKRAAGKSSGPGWQKDDTRLAILDAARRLLDRDGAENCSLSKVAAEAEFATPAVFAYFTSKRELLTALFSQDFAAFAQGLHRVLYPEEHAEDQVEEVANPIQQTVGEVHDAANQNLNSAIEQTAQTSSLEATVMDTAFADSVKAEAMMAEAAAEDMIVLQAMPDDPMLEAAVRPEEAAMLRSAMADAHEDAAEDSGELLQPAELAAAMENPVPAEEAVVEAQSPERPRLLRRNPILAANLPHAHPFAAQASEQSAEETVDATPAEAQAQGTGGIEERLAKLETRRVDAWLERRLRVFERSLTDLETRQGGVEKVSGEAKGLIDQTVADLKEIVAESEARHRDIIKELRNTILQVSSRLESVEARPQIAATDIPAAHVSVLDPSQGGTPKIEEPPQEPPAPQQFSSGKGAQAEPHVDGDTFLSAARKAAKAAQPVPEAPDLKARLLDLVGAKGKKKLPRQTQYLLACCAMLVIMTGTAGFIVSQTPSSANAAISDRRNAALDARFVAADAVKKKTAVTVVVPNKAEAELIVGLQFLTGHGKPKNEAEAARWLMRAADEGNAVAQYRVGMLYRHGLGVETDPAQALRWYEASALQGNRKAMHNLGVANAEGLGIPQNFAEAARWFSQAANLGYLDSEFNLGVLYERGTGVPQSLLNAYKWYAIAAAQNDKESQARVDVLKTQLSGDELSAAEQAADTFTPAPLNTAANETPELPAQTVLAISETGSITTQ